MNTAHGPTHPRFLPGEEQAFVRVLSVPLLGGVRGEFPGPMHGIKVVGALHEPAVARELAEAKYGTATGPRSQRLARAGTQGKSPTPSSLRGRCGRGPPAVRICSVHGPNACAKRKGATHEPAHLALLAPVGCDSELAQRSIANGKCSILNDQWRRPSGELQLISLGIEY
jgi:hypothetical protein